MRIEASPIPTRELKIVDATPRRDRPVGTQVERDTTDTVEFSPASRRTNTSGEPLTEEQTRTVEELEKRDAEVKTHEQAHVAAAGSLFRGGPTYQYQTGPDGKQYAVGGRVQIDTSKADTPEETVTKAQQIRRAALAPQEPSSTDRAVAAKATRMEAEARAEIAEAEREERARADSDEAGSESPQGIAPSFRAALEGYAQATASATPSLDTFG